jgi:hypothetical protein
MDANDAYRRPFMSALQRHSTTLAEKHFAQAAQGDYSLSRRPHAG